MRYYPYIVDGRCSVVVLKSCVESGIGATTKPHLFSYVVKLCRLVANGDDEGVEKVANS